MRRAARLLTEAIPHLQDCFGANCRFAFKVVRDGEGGEALCVTVTGDGDNAAALAEFDRRFWLDNAHRADGELVFDYGWKETPMSELNKWIRARVENPPNPANCPDDWDEAVRRLYDEIKQMLAEARAEGLVSVRDYVEHEEPHRHVMQLGIAGEYVTFTPKWEHGSGRVNLRGDAHVVTLLRDRPTPGGQWLVVIGRTPESVTADLCPQTLQWALARVMRP